MPQSISEVCPHKKPRHCFQIPFSRDILTAIARDRKYNPDQLVYVTDKSQSDHFIGVFSALEALGHTSIAAKCEHVGFGKILGVSTRGGTGVGLKDLVDEAIRYQHQQADMHQK